MARGRQESDSNISVVSKYNIVLNTGKYLYDKTHIGAWRRAAVCRSEQDDNLDVTLCHQTQVSAFVISGQALNKAAPASLESRVYQAACQRMREGMRTEGQHQAG